jgi:pimeloyl-ACP methyl ester carboxylesterase
MTFAQRPLDTARLLSMAACPVILGAGEHDTLVSRTDLVAYVDQPRIAADRGHNVQVEDPDWVIEQILSLTR